MEFQPGQRWRYHTREGDAGSLATILRIEDFPAEGRIVLVALSGLRIPDPHAPDRFRTTISFAPVALEFFQRSVIELHGTGEPPFHDELYAGWRFALDSGSSGAFRQSLADIAHGLERIIRQSRPAG